MHSKVVAVCTSLTKGERKKPVESVEVRRNHGVVGDSHAGNWPRQVSLLALESIQKTQILGLFFDAGDYAENIITKGIVLTSLKIGSKLTLGDAVLEVTQVGDENHPCCAKNHESGGCLMSKEGIFVKVLKGGSIKPGDPIVQGI